mgnify:CR=1 FL=1
MFNPSQEDVRRFFCSVHAKAQAGQAMDALETLAGQWLAEHPEYEAEDQRAHGCVRPRSEIAGEPHGRGDDERDGHDLYSMIHRARRTALAQIGLIGLAHDWYTPKPCRNCEALARVRDPH